MTIFALWHGGPNYSFGEIPRDLEQFASLEDMKTALVDRERLGNTFCQEFNFVFRNPETALTPCVEDSHFLFVDANDKESAARLFSFGDYEIYPEPDFLDNEQ